MGLQAAGPLHHSARHEALRGCPAPSWRLASCPGCALPAAGRGSRSRAPAGPPESSTAGRRRHDFGPRRPLPVRWNTLVPVVRMAMSVRVEIRTVFPPMRHFFFCSKVRGDVFKVMQIGELWQEIRRGRRKETRYVHVPPSATTPYLVPLSWRLINSWHGRPAVYHLLLLTQH